ncbi:hypothetical protein Sjap_026317 [Stephania japonica]|uniref:Uncharacterized protein n=1 Tax=Stephania japonica TaxID=461633 RepID=A0AAP0HIS0_9MAGN
MVVFPGGVPAAWGRRAHCPRRRRWHRGDQPLGASAVWGNCALPNGARRSVAPSGHRRFRTLDSCRHFHKKSSFDYWSNSSYQRDTYSSMRNQPSRDIIRFLLDTEQDMNLTEQELDQWIEQRDQEAEEEINSILQKISVETMSAIPLESIEVNEATPIEDDWSEREEIIEVSLHEPDISIAQNEADEAEKEIDVILERPEKPQKESKEDQPLVLVKPPTLPCIFVKPYKGVDIKERSQIFYATDTFVSVDDDAIDSYVLEVPDELLNLNEGMSDELPKAIDAPFVVFDALLLTHRSREPDITAEFDILILVLNLEDKVWDKFGDVSGIVECGMTGFAHDRCGCQRGRLRVPQRDWNTLELDPSTRRGKGKLEEYID